ncbi:sialate O-acetylesterase [Dyadobacter frigoris]|uniref:T9SS type A sorting domain-containing protein n=1 Tax=Dyadobacter frigoris TaxID=2576211 RepID=A0A4V6BIU7_9BACT|nr:sialate O-acetylesterase [Dyadobacter frigoris]TKT90473.1 T9SS type A sorting domain-containing protein [Dyadobacter frigoris]
MSKSLKTLCVSLKWMFFLLTPVCVNAQISLTAPLERSVYQRELNGSATVTISGSYALAMDKIEVHATPVAANQGTEINWTTLQDKPSGGVFSGTLRLTGGWYKLEVRGSKNGVLIGNSATISRTGVGEVFIISGQSNAQGMIDHGYSNALPPGASEDRVNYVADNNEDNNNTQDLAYPTFKQLNSTEEVMGPRGHGSWCWGILGDLLVKKLNVPVMFVNTAWSGTSIINWVESSQNIPTYSVYTDHTFILPSQMPYGNLRLALQYYVKQYGARTILWMQGESDNDPVKMSFEDYRSRLKFVISKLASDVNKQIPWVIARTSYASNSVFQPIIDAQNAVINDLPGIAYPGPATDNLPATRADGTHFYGTNALTVLANAWNDALTINFFSTVTPVAITDEAKITSVCAPNNTSVNLTLPDGYLNYSWTKEVNGNSSTEGGRSINVSSPGVYYAKLRDAYGNTLRSQKITITGAIKPATPTILQSGSQQECSDSAFTFSINPGTDQYSWYKQGNNNSLSTGSAINVTEAGTYFVNGQNVLGCVSDNSTASSLLIRPQIPTPVIAKSGPFTATATINETGTYESYNWKRDNEILEASATNTIKTNIKGTYAARAFQTFTLGNNVLTCYSPYSNDLEVVTDGDSDFIVYPNPGARDDIYVESREDVENAEIIVYDLYGRIMISQTQDMKSRVKVHVNNLSSGKYILRIKAAGINISKQIIVL